MKDTQYDSVIDELFYGKINSVVICDVCGKDRYNQQRFLDLQLYVKGLKGVEQSLEAQFEFENFTGDNKLTCESEICQGTKTDSRKGYQIAKLPPVLTMSLQRFDLDYETWNRFKIDDRFEYPLELDVRKFLSDEAKIVNDSEDKYIYELKSIVIHRGGAYGGHYYAYIRDDLGEGNWYLDRDIEKQDAPTEIKRKKYDPKDHMSEQQLKDFEEE